MRAEVANELGLQIGNQQFRLGLDRACTGLHRTLMEKFEGHLVEAPGDAVRISVFTWVRRRRYSWPADAIQPFTACIKAALERLPQTHPLEERFAAALHILRHCDPQNAVWQQLHDGNTDEGTPVFAMSGNNLFFYQPRAREVIVLLKKTWRKAHMVAGVLNGTMFALSNLLIRSGGLLLHGCALKREGHTVLLVGKSGSGKTTAARLCRPDICFADDGVVLVREGERFIAHRSPYCQIAGNGRGKSGRKAAVEKLMLLEKHACDRVTVLEKHEMMLFILRHAIHFFKYLDDGAARKGFETVKSLLDVLPVYRLQFTRNGDIWKRISQS